MTKSNILLNPFLRQAILYAVQTHELHQKQKRKGKDIPYILHPMTVGLLLAKAGADDEIIAAGILHDVVEDSVDEHKVTVAMIRERFGERVAQMVHDVSEEDKSLTWSERKRAALEHIAHMNEASLWIKSADTISNTSELVDDIAKDGDVVFERFNASKQEILLNTVAVIKALIARWADYGENPLTADLYTLQKTLEDKS